MLDSPNLLVVAFVLLKFKYDARGGESTVIQAEPQRNTDSSTSKTCIKYSIFLKMNVTVILIISFLKMLRNMS
jgi:hypothetical protein